MKRRTSRRPPRRSPIRRTAQSVRAKSTAPSRTRAISAKARDVRVQRRPRFTSSPAALQARAIARKRTRAAPLHLRQVFHPLTVQHAVRRFTLARGQSPDPSHSPDTSYHSAASHRVPTHGRMPRVLMFGWEFPPQSSGGLGTACEGLGKALVGYGTPLTFVVPHGHPGHSRVAIRGASDAPLHIRGLRSLLAPYLSEEEYAQRVKYQLGSGYGMYGNTLFLEVHRYARAASRIACEEPHDIIHAHDWMSFPAAIAAKRVSGKPFIAHVHATEFDRSGGNPYPAVYHLEREGLHAADKIIAVSNYTKQKIISHYGVSPEKVTVVHNAVEHHLDPTPPQSTPPQSTTPSTKLPQKTVLFLGRLTLQKGPDYFLAAAKKVLEHEPETMFIIAGKGDMEQRIIEQAAAMGIAKNILFAGFAQGAEVDALYRMADLYVMPSVSEPFGITPLEALRNNTPVLISKQSGVSEVLKNALRVDFWDIDEMANKIVSVLRYPALRDELRERGRAEVANMHWDTPAAECLQVYREVLGW